jgi:hypothetical protein
MTSNQQNLVSLVVVVFTVLAVGWLGQKPELQPQGLISLANSSNDSHSKLYSIQEVKIYERMPFTGKVRGELTAELAITSKEDEKDQVQKLVDYARARAGAIGVNAIVVEMVAQRGQVLYFAGKLVEM